MEIEQEAATMGWVPRESFKGDESKWVDAEAFVEKGKHIMPILHKNNERLIGEVGTLKSQIASLQSSIEASKESMEAMRTFHAESTKAQVEKARKEILDNLKLAKSEGEVDTEIALTSELSLFDAEQRAAKAPPQVTVAKLPTTQTISPEVTQWMSENPWYGVDQERTGMAIGVGNRLRSEGNKSIGREFLEAVATIVDERLGDGQRRNTSSKVEGSRGGHSSSSSGGSDYASMPADARAQCDKQAAKFVGANRAFKDTKSWNAYFASEYNKGN